MMEPAYAPLSESCARALGDKVYEKRKVASQEIEKMVTDFNTKKNSAQIRKLIEVLSTDFASSRDANRRKGGLIGLAATSLGLGKDSDKYVNELIPPILCCLNDQDVRVRYFACESLYNVVKVARAASLAYFPDLFSALSRLVTDSDQNVKDGSELLDRLLKDIVTESSQTFNLEAFIPLLKERIYVKNSFARQYVISWISILNAVPEINMVNYLTDILDGLFTMLEDNTLEIQRMCETTISQFLKSIRNDSSSVQMEDTINILITHAQSPNELIKSIAITWIREFVQIFGVNVLPYASGIFTAILPCLEYNVESKKSIKECAIAVNDSMMKLISSKEHKVQNIEKLDLVLVMDVLSHYLGQNSVHTKVAVLKWIHHLFIQFPKKMSEHNVNNLSNNLLGILSDSPDEVVLQCLSVLAEIVNSTIPLTEAGDAPDVGTKKILKSLLNLFSEEKNFMESRASLIIRQLCILLNPEYIYRTCAEIIDSEVNLKFASNMVRLLNMILLTSSELFELRNTIRDITNEKSADLFKCLYKSWAHCPVSAISICLLAQSYKHVSDLVALFADIEITLELLTELDKLVQLIESPIFASLRLTLVSRNNNSDAQYLAHALFGILMLLPQTEAFDSLRNRLQCIPNYWGQPSIDEKSSMQYKSNINFNDLLQHIKQLQKLHREQRLQRKRSAILSDNSISIG